ncbi:MAG: hypothetical protein H7836_04260 [Magnetococcus sp. YQC-3]
MKLEIGNFKGKIMKQFNFDGRLFINRAAWEFWKSIPEDEKHIERTMIFKNKNVEIKWMYFKRFNDWEKFSHKYKKLVKFQDNK